MDNVTRLPKPEIRGEGRVIYRCADCKGPIEFNPVFVPQLPLTPQTKTYHREHVPNGR